MATIVQAIRLALHYGEEHLGVTDIFGEDVGPPLGGVFTATQGLKTAWNSPLDERGIVGTAMGIAYAGGRTPLSPSGAPDGMPERGPAPTMGTVVNHDNGSTTGPAPAGHGRLDRRDRPGP